MYVWLFFLNGSTMAGQLGMPQDPGTHHSITGTVGNVHLVIEIRELQNLEPFGLYSHLRRKSAKLRIRVRSIYTTRLLVNNLSSTLNVANYLRARSSRLSARNRKEQSGGYEYNRDVGKRSQCN